MPWMNTFGWSLPVVLFIGTCGFADEPTARFVTAWGSNGAGPGEFDFPIGVAVNRADEVLITDHYNARVQRFDGDGKLLAAFAVPAGPGGIALDRAGNIYVTHFGAVKSQALSQHQLTVYDSSGKPLRAWGRSGKEAGEFHFPGGVAINAKGNVYVADQTNRRIQVFDTQGKFLQQWGEYGVGPGQFGGNVGRDSRVGGPQFLAFDSHGNIFTTEGSVGRVQQFDADGKFIRAWGSNEDRRGDFGRPFAGTKLQGPIAIAIDAEDRLWISSAGGRVQQFTTTGAVLQCLGEMAGSKPGEFRAPHGLAIDRRGHLYVVDAYNHRVQKFATR